MAMMCGKFTNKSRRTELGEIGEGCNKVRKDVNGRDCKAVSAVDAPGRDGLLRHADRSVSFLAA